VLLGNQLHLQRLGHGGMETQLQAFLVTAATLLTFRATGAPEPLRIATLVLTSLSYGLLLMTRLDSAVVVVVLAMLGCSVWHGRRPVSPCVLSAAPWP